MKIINNIPFRVSLVIILIVALGMIPSLITKEKKNEESEETSSGALESMQWMSQIRAYPDVDIPADKFYKAFEYSRDNLTEEKNLDVLDSWQSLGPNNVGGRSLFLAIHPVDTGTIFMGSASGGLWKSTTGGVGASAWTLINTGYPSSAVSSIAIDSLNPNTMYIGTGENYGYQYSVINGQNVRVTRGMYGIGILKTTDGGTTWSKSLDWSYNNQRGVWRVIINPKNHSTLYAATSEGVYKSINAGANWNQILNYQMVMDIVLNPIDTTILFASVGDLSVDVPNSNVGIYKSTNAGTSWVKLTDGTHGLPTFWSGKATLAMFQGNPNIVFASIANDPNQATLYLGLYMSTNGGNNWIQKYNNTGFMTNQGWYNNALLIKSSDINSILLGNLDIFRSVNGGTTFTSVSNWAAWNTGATPPGDPESSSSNFSHADQHYFCSNPKDPNKIYSITDGGLYRSNDFGTTFYSCNGGYVTTQFYSNLGQSYTDSIFCLGGLQDNRAVFYEGTTAWYKTFQGDGFSSAVNSQNNNICYTEYAWGDIYRSADGGIGWSDISPANAYNEANYCFCAPYVVCRTNPLYLYIGGVTIYKSTNGGVSSNWQGPYGSFGGRKMLSLACSYNGTDTLYCGVIPPTIGSTLRASVFKSVNGGTVWTEIADTNVLPNRYPTDIHIDAVNANIVYVTYGGFNSGHVYKTTNGGGNWSNITSNLPDVPYHCIVTDPLYPQNIYVGNDLGVYVSTNGGTSWSEFRTGMPYALAFDLTIVNASRKLRVTTHGNGIYERKLYQNPLGITGNGNETPKEYKLEQNYPNPFNPSTKINYSVPKAGLVTLKIYDILGKEVSTLVNENKNAGSYTIVFNAANLSSGIYFYRLSSGKFIETKKMLMVK